MAAILVPTNPHGCQIASQVINTNTTTAGNIIALDRDKREVVMHIHCSARTDGTFTPQIDGSMDGTNWIVLKQGTALTATGRNFTTWAVEKDGALPPFVRISILSASVTDGGTLNAQVKIG